MSHRLFFVSETNPNDTTGGGGCICSPQKQTDCKGPYCVFPGNDMENIISPHVVVGAPCVAAMLEKLSHGEVFAAGEHMDTVTADAQPWKGAARQPLVDVRDIPQGTDPLPKPVVVDAESWDEDDELDV